MTQLPGKLYYMVYPSRLSSRMDLQVKSDPVSGHYGTPKPDESSPTVAGDTDSQQSKKNNVRKRTKTGCLSRSNRHALPLDTAIC